MLFPIWLMVMDGPTQGASGCSVNLVAALQHVTGVNLQSCYITSHSWQKNIAAQMKHFYTVGPIHVRKRILCVGWKKKNNALARSFCSPVGN